MDGRKSILHEIESTHNNVIAFFTASEASFARGWQDGFDGFRGVRSRGAEAVLGCTPTLHGDATTKKGANPNRATSRRKNKR